MMLGRLIGGSVGHCGSRRLRDVMMGMMTTTENVDPLGRRDAFISK
jgi:hypothetical protein